MNVWGIASLTVFFAVIAPLSLLVIARTPTPPHLRERRTRKMVPLLVGVGFACLYAAALFHFETVAQAPGVPSPATGEVHRLKQKSRAYYVTEERKRLLTFSAIGAFSVMILSISLAGVYHPGIIKRGRWPFDETRPGA